MKLPKIELPAALAHLDSRQKMILGLAFVVGAYVVYKWQQGSMSNPLLLGTDRLPTTFGSAQPHTALPVTPAKTPVPVEMTAEQAANVLASQSLQQQLPSMFGGDPSGYHPTESQQAASQKVTSLAQHQAAQTWGAF